MVSFFSITAILDTSFLSKLNIYSQFCQLSQSAITCSKVTIETLKKGMKYVES